MHEISLVRNIFSTLESELSQPDLKALKQIDLKIGLLSNVQPTLMESAFKAVTKAEEKYLNVKLTVESVPIEVYCEICKINSRILNYKFCCSKCNTPNKNIVKGEELLIHKLHFLE